MSQLRMTVEAAPSADDLNALEGGLLVHNEQQEVPRTLVPLAVFLRDEAGHILGGVAGNTVWGWLQIKLMWVADGLRGQGHGARLIRAAEQEAFARGCKQAWVDTFTFQALGFYQKQGYTIFGVLDDFPEGHTRYFLKKTDLQGG